MRAVCWIVLAACGGGGETADPPRGELDLEFQAQIGDGFIGAPQVVAIDGAGNIVVGGAFTQFQGAPQPFLVRLTSSGQLDTGFAIGDGPDGEVHAIAPLPDGGLLVGGMFTSFDGISSRGLVRLDASGALDTTFTPLTGAITDVKRIVPQPDGKVLVAGSFETLDGDRGILRISVDGSPDPELRTNFDPAMIDGGRLLLSADSLALQADGKIVVAGTVAYEVVGEKKLFRLDADGAVDTTFVIGTLSGETHRLVQDAAGGILVGGSTTEYTTTSAATVGRLLRLTETGALDDAFAAAIDLGFSRDVRACLLQDNGKILVAGEFATFGEIERQGLARLTGEGSLDSSFVPSLDGTVNDIALDAEQGLIAVGDFQAYDGTSVGGIVRLK